MRQIWNVIIDGPWWGSLLVVLAMAVFIVIVSMLIRLAWDVLVAMWWD